MVTHWVVVSDAARARTFESNLMLEALLPLEGRVHPASRMKAHDLVGGDRGSTREMQGGAKSRFERHTDPHQAEADHFAKELAELAGNGVVGHVIQILDPAEETLPYAGRAEFLGLEGGERWIADRVFDAHARVEQRVPRHEIVLLPALQELVELREQRVRSDGFEFHGKLRLRGLTRCARPSCR